VKVHTEFAQGSGDWHQARCGLPTCSEWSKILTPKKLELSAQAEGYANRLVAERLIGRPVGIDQSYFMERGQDLEDEARRAFEFETGLDVMQVGLCTDDAERYGCSPDGLIMEYVPSMPDGEPDAQPTEGLEIKCPSPGVHVGYMLAHKADPEWYPPEYRAQIQGSLLVTGLPVWHWYSYHPDMDPVHVEVTPEPEYQAKLRSALGELLNLIDGKLAALRPSHETE